MPDPTNILGKYEILEELGDGAQGRVYKARCLEGAAGGTKGEIVALKRLRSTGQDKESRQFKNEAEILRRLNHEGIVRYKDFFIWRERQLDEEIHCLVTEFLDGQMLKEVLEQNAKGVSWDKARPILHQTLSALAYAASVQVVHRDLKPSNIYITTNQSVKLIDFGIAREKDGGATSTASTAGFRGTFDYMAPDFVLLKDAAMQDEGEEVSGFRGDERSDIYSFGICFYEMLTGRLPFGKLSANSEIEFVVRYLKEPPKVSFQHPIFDILNGARACVRRCLELKREDRFQTFAEALAAFEEIRPRRLTHHEDEYEYCGYLGRGGFGKVFQARRLRDGRQTAIKELVSDRQTGRFVREAKILQKAQHPHLVQYLDFVEVKEQLPGDERRFYIILEFLEGMPAAGLSSRIKKSGSGLDPKEMLRLYLGYLDCLQHLHEIGIIHRDIKPGNLYAPEGKPEYGKIFDLGIAHDSEGTRSHGQVPGTFEYMPPEFASTESGRGSAQSDIYAIGVSLYQALAGELPFSRLPTSESEALVAFFRRAEGPQDYPFDAPVFQTHPELVALLRRAMAHKPGERHASAKEMRLEVARVLDQWETYEQNVASARAALARCDFAEAKRLAEVVLALRPKDLTGLELASQARGVLLQSLSPDDASEAPTVIPTRPMDGDEEDAVTVVAASNTTEERPTPATTAGGPPTPSKPGAQETVELPKKPPARRRLMPWAASVIGLLVVGGLYFGWKASQHGPPVEPGKTVANPKPIEAPSRSPEVIAEKLNQAPSAAGVTPVPPPAGTANDALRLFEDTPPSVGVKAPPINIPCHVSDPAKVKVSLLHPSYLPVWLPAENVRFKAAPKGGATNGFIVIEPVHGYAGSAVIELLATAEGATPVTNTIQLEVSGPIDLPTMKAEQTDIVLDTGGRQEAKVTLDHYYDFKAEQMRLEPQAQRDGIVSVEITGTEATRTVSISGKRAGVAEIDLTLTAPNGQQSKTSLYAKVNLREQHFFTNSIGMILVWVAGLPGTETADWQGRTGGGWVGRCEVTQAEFVNALKDNPSKPALGGRYPVENMSFDQAARFCDELTTVDRPLLAPRWHYALPTESQWEFFAAGTQATPQYALFQHREMKGPQPVGKLSANKLDLLDVLGNVAELTATHWRYPSDNASDTNFYICRGGSYGSITDTLSTTNAFDPLPWMFTGPQRDTGFRVVLAPMGE